MFYVTLELNSQSECIPDNGLIQEKLRVELIEKSVSNEARLA
ncbi:hypothetical protein [Pseudoalteromonas sp. KS88]|nr:hypothetical protein [Pseudoalteromonas sp. KS88]MDB2356380.1 hypothetical protein [Pseudoalteromonas sp.]